MQQRMTWIAAAMLIVGLTYFGFAEGEAEKAREADPALQTFQQKASYWVGYATARQMGPQIKDLDLQAMLLGMGDAKDNKDPRLTEQQVRDAMTQMQKHMQEKVQAQAKANQDKGDQFLVDNAEKEGVKTTESGLQYKVIKAGEGESPAADDTVSVHYEGKLIDGTVFDSSYKRGEPTSFPVNRVIPGWTEALQLMKPGAKWQLFIPAKLAYGERGSGGAIGPNETLLFTVELLEVKKAEAQPDPAPEQ